MQYSPNSRTLTWTTTPEDPETTPPRSEEDAAIASAPKKRAAGRKKFKETRHPVYRGVRRRNSDRWVCELREPRHQKRIWLGTYPTPEMAARAHDVAVLALYGGDAAPRLNFSDSAWRLPVLASTTDSKDLREAASAAAEAFRPAAAGEVERRSEDAAQAFWYGGTSEGVAGMAEGVLMSPPPLMGWKFNWDEVGNDAEVELELWSF